MDRLADGTGGTMRVGRYLWVLAQLHSIRAFKCGPGVLNYLQMLPIRDLESVNLPEATPVSDSVSASASITHFHPACLKGENPLDALGGKEGEGWDTEQARDWCKCK